jgi:hypothetical protein
VTGHRRRPASRWALGVVAAVVTGLAGCGSADGGEPLALLLPASDAASSCVPFDAGTLGGMPVAFAGTVTAADAAQVTLDVDRWFAGGDAEQVRLAVPDGQTSAALDGVDFRAGERYLVTATDDGTVNGCGYSGPATADFEDAFDRAFGG